MKIGNIQLPYFIQDIKEHNDIKDMLLKMIEEDPGVPTGQNANDNNDDDKITIAIK
mgnify:CR=1 FL=1